MDRRKPDRDALDEHAARQHGLFTRTQALACGFSQYRIRARCRCGDWVVVLRDVFADRGLPLTPQARDVAAQLALPGSVLAGPSAARWHGMQVASEDTFVVGAGRRRLRRVHTLPETVAAQDICFFSEVCVTTLDRTVFDCLRLLPDAAALKLLEEALQRGWTSTAQLSQRLRDATSRHGTPRLIRLLQEAAHGSRSASQRLATRLLQRAGVWGWYTNEPVSDRWGLICIGDIVFAEAMLVIELDGAAFDPDGERAQRDRERYRRLAAAGWTVLRFTWIDLTTRPGEVIAEIRSLLDRLGVHSW